MDILILPTVAEVALPAEETNQTALVDKSIAFGREVVVFVDFGESVGEIVSLMIDGVTEGEFDEIEFGEDFLHLWHNKLTEAVVIVDMQEASSYQVIAQILSLLSGEDDIAVASDMKEGIVEYFTASHIDGGIFGVEVHMLILVAEGDEVGEGGGVGIPVATTIVAHQGDLRLLGHQR